MTMLGAKPHLSQKGAGFHQIPLKAQNHKEVPRMLASFHAVVNLMTTTYRERL